MRDFSFVFVKRNEKQTFLSKLSLPAGRTVFGRTFFRPHSNEGQGEETEMPTHSQRELTLLPGNCGLRNIV